MTNFLQNVTEPSKGISYPVGDPCQRFTKLTGPCAYTLHSNQIPPTDGRNGVLWLVAYVSQTSHQCFSVCFCHPTVGNIDVSPYLSLENTPGTYCFWEGVLFGRAYFSKYILHLKWSFYRLHITRLLPVEKSKKKVRKTSIVTIRTYHNR